MNHKAGSSLGTASCLPGCCSMVRTWTRSGNSVPKKMGSIPAWGLVSVSEIGFPWIWRSSGWQDYCFVRLQKSGRMMKVKRKGTRFLPLWNARSWRPLWKRNLEGMWRRGNCYRQRVAGRQQPADSKSTYAGFYVAFFQFNVQLLAVNGLIFCSAKLLCRASCLFDC